MLAISRVTCLVGLHNALSRWKTSGCQVAHVSHEKLAGGKTEKERHRRVKKCEIRHAFSGERKSNLEQEEVKGGNGGRHRRQQRQFLWGTFFGGKCGCGRFDVGPDFLGRWLSPTDLSHLGDTRHKTGTPEREEKVAGENHLRIVTYEGEDGDGGEAEAPRDIGLSMEGGRRAGDGRVSARRGRGGRRHCRRSHTHAGSRKSDA